MSDLSVVPLGTLVALGGGDDDALLALLSDMLPTPDAPLEIVTVASPNASRTASAYEKAFRELGCRNAHHLTINEHYRADAPATLRRLRRASLVFFSGGDQERITDFLQHTEFLTILRERYQQDAAFIVAGTSAGAAALPDIMLVAGYGWRALRKGGIQTKPGLGLLPRVLIDQHFVERGRFGRLAHALLTHSMCLGLGLSEETGVIIRGGQEAEVFGDGIVMVVDGHQLTGSNLGRIGRGEPVSGQNLRVHLLVAGQRLNLETRELISAEGQTFQEEADVR
ncbi:cyanophycinase [Hymenobacter gelipurpurascens]|uniref:Cyanophycinase n=1 Tax=Hymenobacter gelipurpurascens TaxID=89968 RepID=A0A212UGF0_9BACT|nr:cyanophycinase [Hymenobacter gelipurpurascens]SNC77315.1 cyanophycinase [Hymenobacter gelipurpurascens]